MTTSLLGSTGVSPAFVTNSRDITGGDTVAMAFTLLIFEVSPMTTRVANIPPMGVWSESAVSDQCGCAAVLRRLAEMGEVTFEDQPSIKQDMPPPVRYSTTRPTDPAELVAAKALQQWLSNFFGVFLAADGIAGPKTSDAFKLVTGHYLVGDPRADNG